MVNEEKVKSLVELVIKSYMELDWVQETCQTEDDEIISKLFKYRTIVTNYLQGCPFYMIDHVYYPNIFKCAPSFTSY